MDNPFTFYKRFHSAIHTWCVPLLEDSVCPPYAFVEMSLVARTFVRLSYLYAALWLLIESSMCIYWANVAMHRPEQAADTDLLHAYIVGHPATRCCV